MYAKSIAMLAFLVLSLVAAPVFAQCACGATTTSYVPVEPSYSTYYAPTTTYYAPEPYTTYYAPTTTYYAPASYATYYAPRATYYAPAPYRSYYAPTTAYYAPAPYTSYYAPTTAYYAPAISGVSIYGTPKIYVPGEPVRNTLRALSP